MMEACVVGASTGGVSALRSLLRGLDKGFRPSVIIVQHTATEGFNVLVDLLRDSCVLPVSEAQSREPIQPGHVYLAPPRYHLLVERQQRFALSVDERVCHVRPAADVLFQSAAEVWRDRLAAVVLTGANDDGARGAALVRSLGGTLIVQDPQEAEAPEMPAAALRLAGADHVLPLNRIAPMLLKLAGRANA